MSAYKIVRDSAGRCRGSGPNTDSYSPVVPIGGTLELSDVFLAVDPTPSEAVEQQRRDADEAEAQQAKIGAQIQADLNMTPAEVATLIDVTLFSAWSAPQRVFMKRLVRMVIAAARKVLR